MAKDKAFARLPGFRDFPPEELQIRSHVFESWRRISRRYGFQEYDGPPLEALDLYTEKSGEEIVGQLYAFEDKGGREITLRPEMTPSLARILGERSRAMPKPIRWFTLPQLFRYERQQRGRLREHFQWNVDIIGEAGVGADAEILAVALDALRDLGLGKNDIVARVSDRRLLTAVLSSLGVSPEHHLVAFEIVDKVEREEASRSLQRLREECGLSESDAEAFLGLVEDGGPEDIARLHGKGPGVTEALADMQEHQDILARLGLGDFIQFDLRIVRGLAYYTGIVFEIFDRNREFRAVCGGGRYDRLLELVGGEPLPATGFGMGDVVLTELLTDRGLLPDVARDADLFLVSITPELRPLAHEIARAHRESGRRVMYALRDQSVKKQFSSASTEGARWVIILGPDEVEKGVAVVRDMASGTEAEVSLEELRAGKGLGGDDA
ncbi:MAG: histidine--tRNA ligase [Gemmatimonadetes bacterium]|nr:histidine--tRNA ligase [Gemmatimonadota bacterium]